MGFRSNRFRFVIYCQNTPVPDVARYAGAWVYAPLAHIRDRCVDYKDFLKHVGLYVRGGYAAAGEDEETLDNIAELSDVSCP